MKKFRIILTAACTLILVSQLHFTQCSGIHRSPLTAAKPRFSESISTKPISYSARPISYSSRPTSHSTSGAAAVRFSTLQAKAYASALADLLKTIVSSNEFREGSSALGQLLAVLRPLIRAVGIVPPAPLQIVDDTTTTTTTTTAPTTTTTAPTTTKTAPTNPSSPQTIITCPTTDKGPSRKKLMSLFVPMSDFPSSPTSSPPSTGTLPKLFRKADSYIANK